MKPVLLLPALLAFCCLPALGAEATGKKAVAPSSDPHAATVQRLLARMDRDNNGQVSFEEYRNTMSRRFHVADKSGDGVLQANELPEEWVVVNTGDIPANGMSLESFSEHMRASFASFDANQDGSLDNDELLVLAKARAARQEATP